MSQNESSIQAAIPQELIEIYSRSRFIIPREEVLVPLVKFILREQKKREYYISNGLSWPLNSTLTIRGMAGIGKTTLAATIANCAEIRHTYDRICFINLGDQFIAKGGVNNITYNMYLTCLRKLCYQIGAHTNYFHEEIAYLPGDTLLEKSAKTIQTIEKLKERMTQLFDGLRIFLILDDVWSHEDIELFNFGEEKMKSSFTLFITTRTLDMFPSSGSCWIDIPFLRPPDAVSFFFLESGRGETLPTDGEFIIARKVVEKCGFLPLAIKIAAKVAQAYPNFLCSENGVEGILTKQFNYSNGINGADRTLVNLLHRSFSFVTDVDVSDAIKICFGAMAVVFHRDGNLRPWISQKTVENFWYKLLNTYGDLKLCLLKLQKYRIRSMADIMHLLCIMGLIDKRKAKEGKYIIESFQIQIHHDLLFDYGKMVAIEFTQEKKSINRSNEQSVDLTKNFPDDNSVGFKNAVVRWNELVIECYQDKLDRIESNSDSDFDYESDPFTPNGHMLSWLPLHMMKARKFSAVVSLLSKRSFLRDRIEFRGVLGGTKLHVLDIRELQKMKQIEHEGSNANEIVISKTELIPILLLVRIFLFDFGNSLCSMESKVEMGHALVLLGVTEQAFALWQKSLECYNKALMVFQSIGLDDSHPYIISTKKHIDVFSVMIVWLVPINSPHCVRLKYPKELDGFSDEASKLSLELSSHPGKGIVCMSEFHRPLSFVRNRNIMFAGIGPKEASACVIKEGNLLRCTNSCDLLRCMYTVQNGTVVVWNNSEDKAKQTGEWIIHDDGKISPIKAPHLCLGTTAQCALHLVPSGSPNQLVFRHHAKMKQLQNQINVTEKKGIPLTLSSHPNCGIMFGKLGLMKFEFVVAACLFIGGPVESSALARFSEKQEIIFDEHGGLVMRTCSNILENGNLLIATRDDCAQPRPGMAFQVNDDGSISPVEAPDLVLGFPEITTPSSEAKELISVDEPLDIVKYY